MSIYTVVGDLHLKPDNVDKVVKLFFQIESLNNPVIMLGDSLDSKEIIRGTCLNLLYEQVKQSNLKWIFIIGNHCWFNNQCEDHSLKVLKTLSNVTIVDKLYLSENLCIVPFIHDLNKFKETVKPFSNKDTVLFAHQGINNFDFGSGHLESNGVNLEEIQGFKRVISGHFHKYQQEGNLTYLGTPFSHSFGESNQTKYIGVYDTSNDQLELIRTNLPQHMTRTIDCDINANVEHLYEFPSKDIHRAILIGKEANIHKFQKKLYPNVKFIEQPAIEESNNQIKETDSPEKTFLKWAKDIKKLDQKTIDLGLSILKDTVNV